jgi:glycosyltransferase 2 family protein
MPMNRLPKKSRLRPSWFVPALRIAISVAILIVLGYELNARSIAEVMLQVSTTKIIAASGVLFCISIPMSVRCKLVIASDGHQLGFFDVWAITLIGLFFNQVLPTSIGGDVIRGVYIHRVGLSAASAARSIFIDRALGFVVLTLCVVPGLIFLFPQGKATFALLSLALVVALALGAFVIVCILDLFAPLLPKSLAAPAKDQSLSRLGRVLRTLIAVSPQLRKLLREPRIWVPILLLSTLSQAGIFSVVVIFAQTVNNRVQIAEVLAIVPVALLLANIPISIAGWGVREGAMIGAMSLVGFEAQEAATVSILFGLSLLISSLPGGIAWWVMDRKLAVMRTSQS